MWSSTGTLVAVIAEDSFYILSFDRQAYNARLEAGGDITDEGVEESFDVTAEVPEKSVLCVITSPVYLSHIRFSPYLGSRLQNGSESASCIPMLGTG